MHKKVLIVSYYWPPAGGPGVQRWLKFVKYLPEFGVEPVVFVPENANYPIVDQSLENEVREHTTVIKHKINEPYKFAKLFSKTKVDTISKGIITDDRQQSFLERSMLFIRGNFFVPDARVGWVKPATKVLLSYIDAHNITTVITTGPPHSMHLIGLNLKKKLTINWLADFRDPWTTIGYHKQLKLTKHTRRKHKNLEKRVLKNADKIIVTSAVTKKEFKKLSNTSIEVITNGFDNEPTETGELDEKFTLSHIGSLLSKRNPKVLWQLLSDLIHEVDGFKDDFQLNFIGYVSDNVLKLLNEYGLTKHINNAGYVNHLESIRFQKKSQLLLLIEIDSEETKCIIPGKLFEYMISHRPIIAVGPKGSDVERIITETNTGNYFSYTDYELLKKVILEHYKAFKEGSVSTHPIGLQKYHRRALTQKLSQLL